MKKREFLLVFTVLAVFISLGAAGCGQKGDPQQLASLATCLADKDVKEYGAFWCPHCADQARAFGSEAEEILKTRGVYVECDPRCARGDDGKLIAACDGVEGQAELCLERGIDSYPTWTFPDGSVLNGVQEPSVLAEKAGCEYTSVPA